MDATSTLKSELFRPLATILVPGFLASAPFLLIVANTFAVDPLSVMDRRPVPAATLIFVISLIAGFVLENLGSLYEHFVIDKLLPKKFPHFKRVWHSYLRMRIKHEVIGQRYLQTIRIRLKFELAMAPALVLLAIGVACLNWSNNVWKWWPTFHVFVFMVLAVLAYLLYEAYRSAFVLAETRELLVNQEQPTQPSTLPNHVENRA